MRELSSERVAVISEDSYYKGYSELPIEERRLLNFDHPDAFEHSLLCQHIGELKKGNAVNIPVYDYKLHTRSSDTLKIKSATIVVVEGILLLSNPQVREFMDIKIYVDTPLDLCILRRIKRDIIDRGRSIECVMDQYTTNVRPMFLGFIEPSKKYADLIVPNGGKNMVAIDVIKAKMRELLDC